MGRILAIDYGRKRVGLAVSDSDRMIAGKLATIATHEIWNFLKCYIQNEQVDEVVVGYPVQLNNQPSEAVIYINPFLKKFSRMYPNIKLETIDERFTSRMALMAMIEGGIKKKDRQKKDMIDAVSATIILQSYMERKRNEI